MEVKIEQISDAEGRLVGFPTNEPDFGITWMKASIPGSSIHFEEGASMIWVISIVTQKPYRNRGLATILIRALFDYAGDKRIDFGAFSEPGDKYLRPLISRLLDR